MDRCAEGFESCGYMFHPFAANDRIADHLKNMPVVDEQFSPWPFRSPPVFLGSNTPGYEGAQAELASPGQSY